MNGWKALETTEMSTPQKFRLKLANCGNPTDWEDLLPRQLEDLLQKSFTQLHATAHYQPSCEVCDVTASVVGFVSPLWVAHLWCIVSDQYLKNDDHIYQVTRLTHQDGMLRPVKMLIFLRTLGCCFLNLGSEASTSSDLSLPLAFWPKTPLKLTQPSRYSAQHALTVLNSNTCKALTSSECTALEMSFFSSCLSATTEGITIRQGNFVGSGDMTQTWSIFQLLVLTKRVLPSVTLIYSKSWKKKGSQWSVGLLDTSRFKYEPSCDWYSKKNLKFHWFSTEIHHLDMFMGFFMVLNFENDPILGLHPQQCRCWKWNLTTWWTLHPINHVVGWWRRHWWRLDGRFVWG